MLPRYVIRRVLLSKFICVIVDVLIWPDGFLNNCCNKRSFWIRNGVAGGLQKGHVTEAYLSLPNCYSSDNKALVRAGNGYWLRSLIAIRDASLVLYEEAVSEE